MLNHLSSTAGGRPGHARDGLHQAIPGCALRDHRGVQAERHRWSPRFPPCRGPPPHPVLGPARKNHGATPPAGPGLEQSPSDGTTAHVLTAGDLAVPPGNPARWCITARPVEHAAVEHQRGLRGPAAAKPGEAQGRHERRTASGLGAQLEASGGLGVCHPFRHVLRWTTLRAHSGRYKRVRHGGPH